MAQKKNLQLFLDWLVTMWIKACTYNSFWSNGSERQISILVVFFIKKNIEGKNTPLVEELNLICTHTYTAFHALMLFIKLLFGFIPGCPAILSLTMRNKLKPHNSRFEHAIALHILMNGASGTNWGSFHHHRSIYSLHVACTREMVLLKCCN